MVGDDTQIIPLTPREQAFNYPYTAPDGAYLMAGGAVQSLKDLAVLEGRIAVLSVGSNRAPRQLLRKFGVDAIVPVTPAILKNCDICHVANIAPYGAIPCSAFPSHGTSVYLNVAWLDSVQLIKMHATESLGDAYEFIRWHPDSIIHQIDVPAQPVYGYASLLGMLPSAKGEPLALLAIKAENRCFETASQSEAMAQAQALSEVGAELSQEEWVIMMQQDQAAQESYRRKIAPMGIRSEVRHWDVMTDLLV